MPRYYRDLAAVLVAVVVMLLLSSACLAQAPMRVAILPVREDPYVQDTTVNEVIKQALTRRFELPFADIIPIYVLIPPADILAALPAAPANIKPDQALLARVAACTKADIVIAPAITRFTAYTYSNRWGELMQKTNLAIRLSVYNARLGQSAAVESFRLYDGDWSVRGDADALAREIMDELLSRHQVQVLLN